MKRRDVLASAGIGSAAVLGGAAGARTAARGHEDEHAHESINGPLANATVSFGAWPAPGPTPTARRPLPTTPAAPNIHQLLPRTATIKAGGSVNFIVAGFHQ